MKVALLAGEIGHPTSGQSRFTLNLARGLRAAGIEVAVVATRFQGDSGPDLTRTGIRAIAAGDPARGRFAEARLLTLRSDVGRRVGERATREFPADWYVVLSDVAVDAIEALPPERSAYLSQGDLALLYLNDAFYRSHRMAKRWLARSMAPYILQNAARARRYRVLLANSEFTRNLMSFLYAAPFQGVVHPPVDLDLFQPSSKTEEPPYVLALGRNQHEPGLEILEELARQVPLRVVGGAAVPGAMSVGAVTDLELARLYSGARFTVAPGIAELFGYAVAESLACGTPVMAFDAAGPAEQVTDGSNGWLVRRSEAFVPGALRQFQAGTSNDLRVRARASVAERSPRHAADRLIAYLDAAL